MRRTETAVEGGFREFMEESRGIFASEVSSPDALNKCMALCHDGMAIIFVPVDDSVMQSTRQTFDAVVPLRKSAEEVSEIVWVDEDAFRKLIHTSVGGRGSNVLWKKIQMFLRRFVSSFKFSEWLFEAPGSQEERVAKPRGDVTLVAG